MSLSNRLLATTLAVFLGTNAMNAGTFTPQERDALHRLDTATDWLVRYGAFVTMARGKDFLKSKLNQLGPVLLWVTPLVREQGRLADFRIKAAGYNYDIAAIHAREISGVEHIYWVTHASAQGWAIPYRGCRFHITRTEPDGKMAVMAQSDSFIASYKTASGEVFSLPLDDLKTLNDLRAWRFPECFEGTDLARTKVELDENSEFIARPNHPPADP